MGFRCAGIAGQFRAFPSKANKEPAKQDKKRLEEAGEWDHLDPGAGCDDGDQTTYNGMLCAAGVLDGCRSIADAQDRAGRMYRSPHRRWLWAERCSAYKRDSKFKEFFNDRCAYGFSPDMNLGVLLYALKTKDTARYQRWLNWLDDFARTTQLCKKNGDTFYDCQQIDWPRVCPEDMGNGQDAGTAIGDRYGGKCALRPTDAMDFAAVNAALGIAPPPRMNAWDVQSRALIKGAEATANGIVPIGTVFSRYPLVVLSTIDRRNFPAHLDAIRVLIRMMILNPSLQLNNLPPIPEPQDLLPGVLEAATSDSTDILSINAAAKALALQDPDNPFYALLSQGPTSAVRGKIIDACPAIDGTSDAANWIWEKAPGEEARDKKHSMGWDCVFVGSLYNRMRVKKDLAEELLDLLLKLADPTEKILKDAAQALQLAEATNKAAQDAVNIGEANLQNALDFVNGLYAQQRQLAKQAIDDLTNRAADLARQVSALEGRASELRNQAITMPDTVAVQVTKKVCEEAEKYIPGADLVCKLVTETENRVNGAKQQVLGQISSIESQIRNLRDQQITAIQAEILAKTRLIADLDAKFQSAQAALQSKTLETTARLARETLKQTGKALYEARKLTAAAKRAYAKLKGNLAVWKNDRSQVADVDLTPVPPIEPPPALLPASTVAPANPAPTGQTHGQLVRLGEHPAQTRPEHHAYYSIVASFHTKRAAERQAELLHHKEGDAPLQVLQTRGGGRYWVVTNGEFTSRHAALRVAKESRQRGVATDAYVLKLRR